MVNNVEKPKFDNLEVKETGEKKEKPLIFGKEKVEDKRKAVEKIAKISEKEKEMDGKEQNKVEKDLGDELLKDDFVQKAPSYKDSIKNLEVEVAGEKHNVSFKCFTDQGKEEPDVKKITQNVDKGKSKLQNIDCRLSLVGTKGRTESLSFDLDIPVKKIMTGQLQAAVKNAITNSFGGTTEYYQKLQASKEKPDQRPEKQKEHEADVKKIQEKAKEVGAETSIMHSEKITSLIVNIPQKNKQLHLSTVDRTSWHVAIVSSGAISKELAGNSPQEILSLVEKETK
jgi:hypothetical protein